MTEVPNAADPSTADPVGTEPVGTEPAGTEPVVTPGPGGSAIPAAGGIDPRGPRFTAAITSVVLAIALVTGWWEVLAFQALMFAIPAVLGLQYSPYGYLFRSLVRPRLGPPSELEDPEPPRFAQLVGLIVTGIGLVLAGLAVPYAVEVFSGLALIAALLNATIGLCLGCEIYLRLNLASADRSRARSAVQPSNSQ